MHNYNGFRSRCDSVFDIFWVNADGIRINICKHRRSAEIISRGDSGPISKTRHDDLVTNADTHAIQGSEDRSRSIMIRQAVLSTKQLGIFFLKFLRYIKAGHPTGPQYF